MYFANVKVKRFCKPFADKTTCKIVLQKRKLSRRAVYSFHRHNLRFPNFQ